MINSQGGYQSGPGVDVTCDIYFVGHCTDHVSRCQAGRVWKQVKRCSDSLFAGALDAIDGTPHTLVADQGKEFASAAFCAWCESKSICVCQCTVWAWERHGKRALLNVQELASRLWLVLYVKLMRWQHSARCKRLQVKPLQPTMQIRMKLVLAECSWSQDAILKFVVTCSMILAKGWLSIPCLKLSPQ